MKTTTIIAFLLIAAVAVPVASQASEPAPEMPETFAASSAELAPIEIPEELLMAPPSPPLLPPLPNPTDGFPSSGLNNAPSFNNAVPVSADQMRRDAEAARRLPERPPVQAPIGPVGASNDRYQLQQQIRSLSDYVKRQETDPYPEANGNPALDPWLSAPGPSADPYSTPWELASQDR